MSSLSSLSLIISETPTAPPRTTRRLSRETGRLEHIDEIDTQPPASAALHEISEDISELPTAPGSLSLILDESDAPHLAQLLSEAEPSAAFARIDEIDTIPQPDRPSARALAPVSSASCAGTVDAASWSANPGAADSLAARLRATRSPGRGQPQQGFNPLDRVRWWLLRPGRIEFLLWLSGSILLFGITFLLLLAIVLNLAPPARGNFPTSAVTSTGALTPTVSAGLRLELSSKAAFVSGAELRLQGQGFHPRSQVVFLLDGRWPLLDQRGQAASVQTDASGHFAVTLWLGEGANWSAGSHELLAREMDNGQQTAISITITASSAASTPSNPAPRNTPVSPAYPTVTPATSTPVQATPTQPASTATPAASPTATVTPAGTATPTSKKTPGSSSLGNDLKNGNDGSLFARLSRLNPLVWFIGCCYLLSLLSMGLAGVLRRRRR